MWVVDSDVVVAQSRNNMCIWYNIDVPEQVTLITIKGKIVEIVRLDGKTEVVAQEGSHQLGYELDEGLVEFGTALHDNDFGRAITFLENLRDKLEAEGMWTNLANIAVAENDLKIAQRCYAALGDVACSHFLKETIKIAENYAKEYGGNGMQSPDVLARMAMFNKTFKEAEAIYIEHNHLDKVIEMYQKLHKWDGV